ncbi:MAG: hypothetical protein LQ349_009441 [Xanthoria aureola]|nr:MAG: hypothetical protein LQ349_009441 [Xanthoria aureola]
MPNVLSVDVSKRSLGYVIFCTASRTILSWGTVQLLLQGSSYMPAILEFEQTCNQRAYSVVIIERQLRHVNFQAGRIEANLEALFVARDKQVHLMPAQQKYTCHGLHLPLRLRRTLSTREDAALARQQAKGKTTLSKPQQTRLNKSKAKNITSFFLDIKPQSAEIQGAYDSAAKKDDMADALLQALAYANVGVNREGVHQPEVIDLTD